jgi:hypothetical protein
LPAVILERGIELALGLKHAQVRAFDDCLQSLARTARCGTHREAEGQAGIKLIVDVDQPVDVGDHDIALALVCWWHQDRELIAADSRRMIRLEHGFAQHFAGTSQ